MRNLGAEPGTRRAENGARAAAWGARRAAAAAALALAALALGCASRKAPLNVLLVTLDTTRADRMRCYGYPLNTSPRLDAFARDAVRPVSHASILTGMNPYRHGLRVLFAAKGDSLHAAIPTLQSVLHAGGWETGAFLSSFTVSERFGFARGFDVFDNGLRGPAAGKMQKGPDGVWDWDIRINQRRADETTDAALAWIGARSGPFFAWVHYWDPHDTEIVPPEDLVAAFVRGGTDADRLRQLYDAEIYYVDSQFGRLVDALKKRGQYESTVIVVVADHGQGLGDHGWWYHRILYQEQIRVPMMIRVPGAAMGRAVTDLVRTIDIAPTVLEALGQTAPEAIDGASLRVFLRGGEGDGGATGAGESPRIAYADALNLYDLNAGLIAHRPHDDLVFCAMDRTWKLVYRPRLPHASELYKLDADPREMNNLYESDHVEARRLLAYLEGAGGFVDEPLGADEDAEALERLRALGYVGN
jgi:arylsulfatase A-like enzyme